MIKHSIFSILPIFFMILLFGCGKDFLNEKPTTAILQPVTLDDYQSLMENTIVTVSPSLATLAADEYVYISDQSWLSARRATERNSYIWAPDLFEGDNTGGDWSNSYQSIFYSNSVLAGLEKLRPIEKNVQGLNFLTGWALFARAFAYFELVENFAPPYDESSITTLGVPIKLNPSIDDIQPRATVRQNYERIIADIRSALPLLPASITSTNRERPSKVAAHALLSRIFLTMRDYAQAEVYVDSAMQIYNKLIDYNLISQTATEPFTRTNDELIFYKSANSSYPAIKTNGNSYTRINPVLINQYQSNDLRLGSYFIRQNDGAYAMKLQYTGFTTLYPFTGLATDELYLIKAECAARRNDAIVSHTYLNRLLSMRMRSGTFAPTNNSNSNTLLNLVLSERAKELVWRNLRWSDIRRLNKEGRNISLSRTIEGKTYSIEPNDRKFTFPIPNNEIELSGIEQNNRF